MTQTATETKTAVLGEKYEDIVTGFTGLATAHCEYLNGTNMVRLENHEHDRWVEVERISPTSFTS